MRLNTMFITAVCVIFLIKLTMFPECCPRQIFVTMPAEVYFAFPSDAFLLHTLPHVACFQALIGREHWVPDYHEPIMFFHPK